MNIFFSDGDFDKVQSMLFATWEKGLKTGCYYLKTEAKTEPIKSDISYEIRNVQKSETSHSKDQAEEGQAGLYLPDESNNCLMCGC